MESRVGIGVGRSAATLVIAALLVCAAASQAKSLLAPLAAALFIIGVVWPAQRDLPLQQRDHAALPDRAAASGAELAWQIATARASAA